MNQWIYNRSGVGRFASADTIVPDPVNPQAFNRYSYVNNSPIRFSDPSGHLSKDELHDYFGYEGNDEEIIEAMRDDQILESVIAWLIDPDSSFGDVMSLVDSGGQVRGEVMLSLFRNQENPTGAVYRGGLYGISGNLMGQEVIPKSSRGYSHVSNTISAIELQKKYAANFDDLPTNNQQEFTTNMYVDHKGKAYLAAVAGVVVLAGSCAATVGLTCVLTVGGASTLVGVPTPTSVEAPQYYKVIGPHTPQTTVLIIRLLILGHEGSTHRRECIHQARDSLVVSIKKSFVI